jgi:hypothetical protein
MEKLNLDGITMDMDMVISKYNGEIHSCSDTDEIQQISLFCQQNPNDYRRPILMDMINPMFAFSGLYPHIHKPINIKPDSKNDK